MNTNNPWVALALSGTAGNEADRRMAEVELDPNPPKTGTAAFVGKLFEARQTIHALHLKSEDHAEHVALNEFYEDVLDLIDKFVEVYQGKYGRIEQATNLTVDVGSDPTTYLKKLSDAVKAERTKLGEDTDLQNILDEITALANRTIYKLMLSLDVPIELAGNPNHDEQGRFTSGEGASSGSESHKEMKDYEAKHVAAKRNVNDQLASAANDRAATRKALRAEEAREAQPVNHKAEADAAAKRGDRAAMRTHEVARVAGQRAALPKNPRKLTIDQTTAALEARGFKLGKGLGVNRDSGKMEYAVTRPDGTRVALDADAIKKMLYDFDKPKAEAPKAAASDDNTGSRLNFQINGGRPYMSDRTGPGWVAGK